MSAPKTLLADRLANLQSHLGVDADGIIGPISLTTIEKSLGVTPAPGSFSLTVSKKSIDALTFFEISSEAYYNKKLKTPCWPGGESGLTIGIGYDLGFNDAATIKKDWGPYIAAADLQKLSLVAKLSGTKAKDSLSKVKSVSIPLEAAKKVFYQVTLPKFAKLTKATYPGIESLHADAQGALLSLCYNRGCSLVNSDKRKEMRAIKPLVASANYTGIAAQIRSMKRLWNATQSGLLKRRDFEAELVEKSNRIYTEAELIYV